MPFGHVWFLLWVDGHLRLVWWVKFGPGAFGLTIMMFIISLDFIDFLRDSSLVIFLINARMLKGIADAV
ncbi:hypothetical protein HanOQP8_Chr03g0122541 [Helianthus annuus]|nr:hypothetical protein HanHA89_Chr03g0122061 [Helianthus annuus]KAJ0769668.1 hypothetical protein HanLR1_Chr03g0115271 [Helianthus annuus]KAJ0775403.1 hypothetical protein HanOQP8_Chr03g0122541 [Helianthus annuus]